MTRRSPSRRAARAAAVLTLAAAGGAAALPASAGAVTKTFDYTCKFPLLKPQQVAVTVDASFPDRVESGAPTGRTSIVATSVVPAGATRGLFAVSTATIEGTADAAATVASTDGFDLPVTVPTVLEKRSVPESGEFSIRATGSTPSLRFQTPGTAVVSIGDLVLTLTPRLADGQVTGLDTFETECALTAGQDATLARIAVGSADTQAPTAPGAPAASGITKNSVGLSWSGSTDDVGVTGYDVFANGTKVASTTGATSATVTGLTPSTSYSFTVRARDAAGNVSSASAPTTARTLSDAPPTRSLSYDIAGGAKIGSMMRGNVAITGALDLLLDGTTGDAAATLSLSPSRGTLLAFGFLPVSTGIGFVDAGPTTARVNGDAVTVSTSKTLTVSDARVFGINLVTDPRCRTKSPTQITLASGAGFSLSGGGALSGQFAISDLTECGFLTFLVSPLTAGTGNQISVVATPATR